MTRDDVMAMGAGREMDAAIAQMMGWRAFKESRGDYSLCVCVRPDDVMPWLRCQKPEPEKYTEVTCSDAVDIGFYGKGFPAYSTDIAAAFEVVNKWLKPYATFELNVVSLCSEICWSCQFGNNKRADAPTAPLAVCKAALLVVME